MPINLVASSEAVEKSVVVDSTRDRYISRLTSLIFWMSDNGHGGLLSADTLAGCKARAQ
jgi:hypothetical protein